MPQVATSPNLKFTNHWIGIYDPRGPKLIPSKRAVKDLRPLSGKEESADGFIVPADASTLTPVYAKAVAERERESGPDSAKVARAASNLGLFLLQIEKSAEAAKRHLRRALSIDERKTDPAIDADRESLGSRLEAQGKLDEALASFQRQRPKETLRKLPRASFAKLAENDPEHADTYYRKRASIGGEGLRSRIATSCHAVASVCVWHCALAVAIEEAEPSSTGAFHSTSRPKAKPQVTIGILNMLGNLLEGHDRLDEAEQLERAALALSEEKFGPESSQLAVTCTYLADVLWNKKNLREAGLLYRRAIAIDASLYGPDRPETAADMANLGMLMNDAGQPAASIALLRQALAIYEKTLVRQQGSQFVKEHLAG